MLFFGGKMADGKKPEPTGDQQRLAKLERDLTDARFQITAMQRMGGFTDAKQHSIRASNIEKRLELLELDGEMVKDVLAYNSEAWADHLRDRHDADLDRDSAIDATNWRRMRRRLREWAEKRGLMTKRRDVTGARTDENRLRPSTVASS